MKKYRKYKWALAILVTIISIFYGRVSSYAQSTLNLLNHASRQIYERNNNLLDISSSMEKVVNDKEIFVNLEGDQTFQMNVGQEISLNYTIDHKFIDLKNSGSEDNSSNKIEEVVFVVDISSKMNNGERWSGIKNELTNVILNHDSFKNMSVGVVPYNSDILKNKGNKNQQNNYYDFEILYNFTDSNIRDKFRQIFQNGIIYPDSNNKDLNIGLALKQAYTILETKGNSNKNKAIVLIASNDVTYTNEQINALKLDNYKIISVDLSGNSQVNSSLKQLHNILSESESDYIHVPYSQQEGKIKTEDMKGALTKVRESISSGTETKPSPDTFNLNYELSFIFGDSFDYISGDLNKNDEKYTFTDTINYQLQDNNIYSPSKDSTSITFDIKANQIGENLSFSSCELVYSYLDKPIGSQEITCPKITVVENTEEPDETIRILEIQPSNKFSLTKDTEGAATGTENFIEKVNGVLWNVQVDHITMSEFIGKIDQLNGKYDVVVIGKEHGDYTEPFNEKPEYIHNGEKGTNKINNDQNSESQVEYYSENDITDKRAKEILSLINSGQLVFVNESIFELKNTKLYENFSSLSFSNFIKYNKLDISQVIQEYALISEKFKQPVLNILKSPLGDINNNQGDINSRKLGFEFEVYGLPNEQIEVSLYLDINGDGLFRESDEELRTPNGFSVITLDKEGYAHLSESEFYYTMPSDFIGHLSWKLVIQRTNDNYSSDILNYQIGDVKLNRLPQQEKILIKVLQVVPGCGKQNNVYTCGLNANSDFNQLIQNLDYDIQLDVVNVDNFNKLKLDNNQNLSLESYDMIIIGFANSYNEKSISTEAIEALKRFIETGQSVMFTHDTMSYAYKDEAVGRLTREFRSVLGQARFEPIKYTATSPVQLKDPIIYDTLSKSDSIYSLGRWTMGYTKAHLKRFAGEKNTGVPYAGEVYQINEGQITNYPFEISEQDLNQNDDKITISVAKTHYQNFQLNLEQENLVPWYSLSGKYNASASHASYDPYDVRNNYYTYSIGNLTYSGTGHDSNLGGYKEAEIKLFINTIVKAIRGANKAPTFDVFNLTNGMEFFDQQPALNFSITPYDLDKDKMNITVTVENSSGQTKELKYKDKKDNENFEVSIPKEYYDNSTQIKIVISVEDEHGAQATPRTFSVNITNEEKLNVEFIPSKSGYLVGDTVEMQTIFTKEDLNNGYKFSQFNVTVDETDVDGILKDRQSEEIGSNVVVDKDNNQLINKYYYTVGESVLIPSDSSYSKAINIEAQYRYTKSHSNDSITEGEVIKEKITGSLNVREGVVTVKFIDENDKPISNLAPQISLVSDKKQYEGQVDLKTGSVTFRNIPTGTYTLVIEQIPGYNFGTYYEIINNEKIQLSSTLSISYENNNRTVYVSLADPSIKHGLYQGFSEGTVLIDENERILKATSIIQFASSFSLKNKSDSNITLSIDGNIELLKDDKIKVYQVIDHKMKEIHEVELSSHSTTFNLSEKLQEAEVYEIVILYKGKLKQPEKQYTNKIKVNKVSKEAKIRSTGTTDLPDLF